MAFLTAGQRQRMAEAIVAKHRTDTQRNTAGWVARYRAEAAAPGISPAERQRLLDDAAWVEEEGSRECERYMVADVRASLDAATRAARLRCKALAREFAGWRGRAALRVSPARPSARRVVHRPRARAARRHRSTSRGAPKSDSSDPPAPASGRHPTPDLYRIDAPPVTGADEVCVRGVVAAWLRPAGVP